MFLGAVCGGLRGDKGRSSTSLWFFYVTTDGEGSSALGLETCFRDNNCVVGMGEGLVVHKSMEEQTLCS